MNGAPRRSADPLCFSLPLAAVVGAVKKAGANLPPKAKNAAWPLFAGLCWGGVMAMWELDKKKLQKVKRPSTQSCALSPAWARGSRVAHDIGRARLGRLQGLVASMDYIYRDSDLSTLLSWCGRDGWFPAQRSVHVKCLLTALDPGCSRGIHTSPSPTRMRAGKGSWTGVKSRRASPRGDALAFVVVRAR